MTPSQQATYEKEPESVRTTPEQVCPPNAFSQSPRLTPALSLSLGDPQLTTNLFGPTPYAHCLLAFPGAPVSSYADTTSSTAPDHDPAPIGFALYFFNFSTWTGKPGLYVSTFILTSVRQGGDAQGE